MLPLGPFPSAPEDDIFDSLREAAYTRIMAQPVRKPPILDDPAWDEEEPPGLPRLHRWVERPDGGMELLDVPVTPELFLYQEQGDKIVQREIHGFVCSDLYRLLLFRYRSQPDALILMDVAHDLGLGSRPVSPDVSVILGARPEGRRFSFDVKHEGVRPSLIIEVLSPDRKSIRDIDSVDMVRIYEQAGIPEYVLLDPPRPRKPGFLVWGYRLGSRDLYQPMEQDAQGYILSRTAGLLFPVSAEGERLYLLDAKTRLPLRYHEDTEAAREAAEAEVARLREELARLKDG